MNHSEIEDVAARWLSRQAGEHWTDTDQVAFAAWLNAATEHRVAYLRLQAAWRKAGRLSALAGAAAPGSIPARGAWDPQPGSASAAPAAAADPGAKRWGVLGAALAAGVAAIALSVGAFVSGPPASLQLTTSRGALEEALLEDGSRLVVNSNSSLKIEMRADERRVQVLAGEGMFDVAKDRRRPFVVYAGRDRIEAVGTRFAVWRRVNGTRVVVREGVVKLQSTGGRSGRGFSAELSAGSIADVTAAGLHVKNLPLSDIDAVLDWRSGYVAFIDATLEEAAEEFNRHNARKIRVTDPTVAALKVGGRFRSTGPDRFASIVEQSFPVRVEYGPAQITLLPRD